MFKLTRFMAAVLIVLVSTVVAGYAAARGANANGPGSHESLGQLSALVVSLDARVTALESENAGLRALLAGVSRLQDPNTGQDTLRFADMNVQIVSGSGATDDMINGRGNLIIGYNEMRSPDDRRSGSHMLVVGRYNNYAAFGGMVVGTDNAAYAQWASVSGGSGNTASGAASSVSGGYGNTASNMWATASGGANNTASGFHSTVSGGYFNEASGPKSSVTGGARVLAATSLCMVGDDQVNC